MEKKENIGSQMGQTIKKIKFEQRRSRTDDKKVFQILNY
jgi:hypothetical protein